MTDERQVKTATMVGNTLNLSSLSLLSQMKYVAVGGMQRKGTRPPSLRMSDSLLEFDDSPKKVSGRC